MANEPALRILWIAGGRAVLEDEEGFRVDFMLAEIASDDGTIGKLSPIDAFRLGYQAALFVRPAAPGAG